MSDQPPEHTGRSRWGIGVVVVLVAVGVLAATSARGRTGSSLTSTTHSSVANLVADEQRSIADATAQQAALQQQVAALTAARAADSSSVDAARARGAALSGDVGLLPATGAAYTVSLDDAPKGAPVAAGYPAPTPDDLVVHQQDVQGVVNALWAGGATSMTVMGKRLISTSAVRCVGNTLLLEGRVYSPPFVVTALGDPARLAAAVDAARSVQIFKQYVTVYGLRFDAHDAGETTLPGYDGAVSLTGVTAIGGSS